MSVEREPAAWEALYEALFDDYRAATREGSATKVANVLARLEDFRVTDRSGGAISADMHRLYLFIVATEEGCAWESRARFADLSGEQRAVVEDSFPLEARIWLTASPR